MFHIITTSVRGHEDRARGEFHRPGDAKVHVARELRGVSSVWQVFVANSDGERVLRGWRAGRNGTGERWAWEFVR